MAIIVQKHTFLDFTYKYIILCPNFQSDSPILKFMDFFKKLLKNIYKILYFYSYLINFFICYYNNVQKNQYI